MFKHVCLSIHPDQSSQVLLKYISDFNKILLDINRLWVSECSEDSLIFITANVEAEEEEGSATDPQPGSCL